MILPMDSARLEGREDDGVTTILCLGNNPFSDDRDKTGLAAQIADKTGAVVYDCAFPDSSAACKFPVYNPEYTKDHLTFSMWWSASGTMNLQRSTRLQTMNRIPGSRKPLRQ